MSIDYSKLTPGVTYTVADDGRVVRKSDAGKELVLQGCATELEKPFAHADKDGHKVVTLKSGCFDAALQSGGDVKLLIDHDESQCLSTMNSTRLQIHAGAKHLVFRFLIPGSSSSKFAELKDDYETYVPVSIGYDILKADDDTIDGARVQTVLEARLTEVSILSKAPAVSTTYARVASWETCNALQEDYDSGRFELVGKVVSLHRTIKANGGPVAYAHMPSPYDRAANAFMRALQKYNDNHDSDGRFASGGGSDAATAGSSALNGARQAISTALRGAGAAALAPGVAINAALTLAVELGAAILIGNAIVSTFGPGILPESARVMAVTKAVASVDAFLAGLSEAEWKRICTDVLAKLTDEQLVRLGKAIVEP